MRIINALIFVFVMVACAADISFASPHANITHLDGNGSLIRGTSRYALSKGVSLQSGDVIELGEQSYAQVEFSDGAVAAFGGASRLLWFSHADKERESTRLFLLTGMAKVVVPKGTRPLRIETQHSGFVIAEAIAIILTSDNESELFAESGSIRLDNGNSTVRVKEGEYCLQKAGRKPSMLGTPPKTFIAALPIPFRDPLPHLLARLNNRNLPLTKARDFTYDDVEAWLNGPPKVRKYFVNQWRAKARDSSFRKSLERGLSKHPEWRSVLYPEKTVDQTSKSGAGVP